MKYLPFVFLSPLIWIIFTSILYGKTPKGEKRDPGFLFAAFVGGFIFLCAIWGLILLIF